MIKLLIVIGLQERERESRDAPLARLDNLNFNWLNNFRFVFIFLLILGSFFVFTKQVYAATYYVSSSGSDSNDGVSVLTPWAHHPWDGSATGNSASKVLVGGDEVLFKRGDSFSNVYISVDEGGVSGSIITGAYGDGDKPILDAGANFYVILSNGKSNVTFQDLDLRNPTHSLGAVVFMGTMSNGEVARCNVSGGPKHGITFSGEGVTDSSLIDNIIETKASNSYGINAGGSIGLEVSGNVLTNTSIEKNDLENQLIGIYLSDIADSSVHNNTIGADLANRYRTGIKLDNANHNDVYSNIISNAWNGYEYPNSTGSGISLSGTSSYNNIFLNTLEDNSAGIQDSVDLGDGKNKYYYNFISDSKVNSIDFRGSSEINISEIFNNTVIHSPAGDAGHGIDTQMSGKKISIKNNLVTCDKSGSNIECVTIAGPYTDVYVNYNLYYPTNGAKLASGPSGQHDSLSSWQEAVLTDGAILGKELNSFEGAPNFVDSANSNYQLEYTSPAIDAGTDVGLITDYAGNNIYGTPDIGAYEYQPPYTFTLNSMPTTGSVRLYTDGKYRMKTASSTTTVADFSVTPANGVYYATTTQYMDITINTWNTTGNYAKQWTAVSSAGDYLTHATSTVYTIGDLKPNYPYTFLIDGVATTTAIIDNSQCTNSVCTADTLGKIQFTYKGGYSTHDFALQDLTPPIISSISATTEINSATITWITNEEASTKIDYGLTKSYANSTDETDTITRVTNHSMTLTGLDRCTPYYFKVRSIDVANNETISSENIFKTTGCGGGLSPIVFNPPTPPLNTNFQVIVNNNELITNTKEVKLTFVTGSDTKRVAISEDPNFINASLLDYSPEMDFILSNTNGLKTVYVKFFTEYGYASKVVYDSIILKQSLTPIASLTDKTQPSGIIWSPPTNYEYITGPSQIKNYINLIKEPNSNRLYGLPKNKAQTISTTTGEFNNDLYYGLKNNPEVKRLQEFLINQGYLAKGLNTGNYYKQTQDAVRKFQKSKNIIPSNGRFGPLTRGVVNKEI